jgi:DNA polymerase III epsilon subunit-like protein
MSYFSVDVESDAQSPAVGSMVSFGVVKVSDPSITFYGKVKPIVDTWEPEALAVSGFSREEHEGFNNPLEVMESLDIWLAENTDKGRRPIFISDNPAFDWQWMNYYFFKYLGRNPFGHSARRIGDIYCGLVKDARKNRDWKGKYRKTKHTHNPVDDAKGNAEALIAFRDKLDLYIKF